MRIQKAFPRITGQWLTLLMAPLACAALCLMESPPAASASPPPGAAIGSGSTTSSVAPWPMALCDAQHTALAPVSGPLTAKVEWTRNLGGNITPGPVVSANGTIYVATNAGVLHAVDAANGADLWTFNGGAPFSGQVSDLSVSPLILPSGSILFPGPGGTLYELSATGQPEWSHHFASSLTSPVLSGSTVAIGTTAGTLAVLDVSQPSPTLRWTLSVGRQSYGSPVIAPDGHIVTTADDRVVDVVDHGSHGTVAWSHTFKGSVEVSAAVSGDGTIVVGTNDPYEYGFSPGGSVKWQVFRQHSQSYSSPSATPGGLTYFGDNNGVMRVVRTTNGSPVSVDKGNKGLWAAQVVDVHHDVYFGTQSGDIYGFNASGTRLFDLKASGPIDSYPALTANGTLIIGDQAGTLYAIG